MGGANLQGRVEESNGGSSVISRKSDYDNHAANLHCACPLSRSGATSFAQAISIGLILCFRAVFAQMVVELVPTHLRRVSFFVLRRLQHIVLDHRIRARLSCATLRVGVEDSPSVSGSMSRTFNSKDDW